MAEPIRELDTRELALDDCGAEITRTFDALAPGSRIVLIGNCTLPDFMRDLQQERLATLTWSILEMGPERFRILLGRREAEEPLSVSEYLGDDHRRLDELLLETKQLAAVGSFSDAWRRFAEFECGLGWHIDVEDEILFPAFENLTGIVGGPTRVMRGEHQDIRRLMASIRMALDADDVNGTAQAIRELTDVLSVHNRKEERVLYPTTDQSTGGDRERAELVKRILLHLPRNAV